MPSKSFLKLDGVEGESKAARHFGEIEITGWTWGATQLQQAIASGAPQGELSKNLINDLTVSKTLDKTSRILLEACATARQFAEGILSVEVMTSDGNLRQMMMIKMKSVTVASIFSDGGGSERITFNFEKPNVSYANNN